MKAQTLLSEMKSPGSGHPRKRMEQSWTSSTLEYSCHALGAFLLSPQCRFHQTHIGHYAIHIHITSRVRKRLSTQPTHWLQLRLGCIEITLRKCTSQVLCILRDVLCSQYAFQKDWDVIFCNTASGIQQHSLGRHRCCVHVSYDFGHHRLELVELVGLIWNFLTGSTRIFGANFRFIICLDRLDVQKCYFVVLL